ncbi:junctional adhesion molecule 3B-like [Solea solea]|uniref:junctional adhesion molecule 3B-like n=1 Tax=Solea solea TaxID=90069 RepID=UPI00272B2AF6|nr:junctional adhesion molecule 3B-like [Solea solea]
MAKARLAYLLLLFTTHCLFSVLAVELSTDNASLSTNEFEIIELSCKIHSTTTPNPRVEWKKMTTVGTSHVYFDRKVVGDLKNRAILREPASLLILNVTRSDTAIYRCEVAAVNDQKMLAEIMIALVVRVKPEVPKCFVPKWVPSGKPTELSCFEDEGFPDSQYQWFKNKEEIPVDPNTNLNFFNSSYTLDTQKGTLEFTTVRKEDAGEYFCQAKNIAGQAECLPQKMQVYGLDLFWILQGMLLAVTVLLCTTVVLCWVYKKCQKQTRNRDPANEVELVHLRRVDEVDEVDEADFGHKMSFVV